jgi:hypothetical protein
MRVTRREFLKLGLGDGAILVLPFGTSACSSLGEAVLTGGGRV